MLLFNTNDLTVPQILAINANGENPTDLIRLVAADEYRVVVEGLEVGSTGDMIKAVMIMMSTYFVFNIAYPKEVQWFLTFIQKAVLAKHESALRIPTVIKFIASISNT